MSHRILLLFALALLVAEARAEYSIVIGRGIKIEGARESAEGWVSGYVWLVNARRTVFGPVVKGNLRIVAASHAQPEDSYLKTVQLFVLSPVAGDIEESSSEPRFSLIASSPVHERGKYCIPFKPSEIGIPLNETETERGKHDVYCFSKKSLLEAAERMEPRH